MYMLGKLLVNLVFALKYFTDAVSTTLAKTDMQYHSK